MIINELIISESPEIINQNINIENSFIDPKVLNQLKKTKYNIESSDLWTKKFGKQIIFALKNRKTNELITLVVGEIINNPKIKSKKEIFQIQRSWTNKSERRKGYSIGLYNGLAKLFYTIVSDNLQTEESFSLWRKLQKTFPNKISKFNISTNEYTDDEPKHKSEIVFILEQTIRYQTPNSILWDYNQFVI